MAQNKISRRSFLRGAGASATIAAASCMAPSAAACDIKSLWSMDLQILATSVFRVRHCLMAVACWATLPEASALLAA